MKTLCKAIFFLLIALPISAQNIILKGKVMNERGYVLENVNIQDKKSGNGTITANNGAYEIVLKKTK